MTHTQMSTNDSERPGIEESLRPHTSVKLNCPPEFWPVYGYDGHARYVGIYWTPYGDEACYDDGRTSLVGADWSAYLMLEEQQRPMTPAENPFSYAGGSDEEATHMIIIDRITQVAYVVPMEEAWGILDLQWPPLSRMGDVDSTEFLERLSEIAASIQFEPPSIEEIEARLNQHAADLGALLREFGINR